MADLIPERLIETRKKDGISMAEASKRLGLSRPGYLRYESGDRVPSPQMVEIIAQCFGTSSAYLTGLTDDPSPDYVVVSKNKEPLLFDLAIECRKADPEMLEKRLMAYIRKISEVNSSNK